MGTNRTYPPNEDFSKPGIYPLTSADIVAWRIKTVFIAKGALGSEWFPFIYWLIALLVEIVRYNFTPQNGNLDYHGTIRTPTTLQVFQI